VHTIIWALHDEERLLPRDRVSGLGLIGEAAPRLLLDDRDDAGGLREPEGSQPDVDRGLLADADARQERH
jgi:hypothetical protein